MKKGPIAILVALCGCGLFVGTAFARSWVEVPGPTTVAAPGITGIATITDTNAWSVGYQQVNGSFVILAQHWDGSAWSPVATQAPVDPYSFFYGVAALSSSDVWAVGYTVDEDGIIISNLVEHWDGASWQVVTSPDVDFRDNALYAVDALASNDIWAVGSVDTTAGNHHYTPGILHWDGTAWSIVPTPNTAGAILRSVHAISANDVWAVGVGPNGTYTLHWDGSAWSVVPSPNGSGPYNSLQGVSGGSSNDVWAVGVTGTTYLDYVSLALHWNGTAWTKVTTAATGGLDPLSAVVALSANNVIAVGSLDGTPLTERWNGHAWSVIPTPAVEPGAALKAISAGRRGSLWAAGAQGAAELFLRLVR